MLNRASVYDIQQFTKEVHDFVKVRHKNLVRLIGYCDEGEHLALIYEFVGNGNLQDHLSGMFGTVLSWESRLKIIIGVAKGLKYLHRKLQVLHRYIKPTNILLDGNFEAKLADFGMSRSFPTDPNTQASNKIYVMIPRREPYVHSEYFTSNRLTQTSDNYAFGIVLLEMITNQPVVDVKRESPHIATWFDLELAKGDALRLVDPRLNGDFEPNSVRKAMEIARGCAAGIETNMSQVVKELKECLALEKARTR
ncbi:Protein kinase superfamily protein [Raphanus sativus]|uniref:non-specific serine/threonine protein kinase n=1 Tax=Raphanus sativus TaxID=3726 RepID=A0A9W3C663_RAPSA|nr:LRR receptor-like serine/threonine-protein kinase IOS1 [Raphanus sativus]KAJ4917776.1 Protein kinase superfamily protein [Raphanus sativus]